MFQGRVQNSWKADERLLASTSSESGPHSTAGTNCRATSSGDSCGLGGACVDEILIAVGVMDAMEDLLEINPRVPVRPWDGPCTMSQALAAETVSPRGVNWNRAHCEKNASGLS